MRAIQNVAFELDDRLQPKHSKFGQVSRTGELEGVFIERCVSASREQLNATPQRDDYLWHLVCQSAKVSLI